VNNDDKESGCCGSKIGAALSQALRFALRQIPFVRKREERAHVSAFLSKLEGVAESEQKPAVNEPPAIERPSKLRQPEE
jgi:hypothetical protein